ncbi:MAG: hypothetical protein LBU60_03200 [Clostridiales bacterium]|jgi:hypothetical protein|nr:hypothetical protein [Clostridiales bacterium]
MMRQDFVVSATLTHMYYTRNMCDIIGSILLSVSNFDRQTNFELYRQLTQWLDLSVHCAKNFSLDDMDKKMFCTEFSMDAWQKTVEYIDGSKSTHVLSVCQLLAHDRNLVGRLHTVYENLCQINEFSNCLLQQLSCKLEYLIDNFNLKICCLLPYNIVQYFKSTIQSYQTKVCKLGENQPFQFHISKNYTEKHASYLLNTLENAVGDDSLYLSLSKCLDDIKRNDNTSYFQLLPHIASAIIKDNHTVKSTTLPCLIDNFLRYAHAQSI